MQHMPFGEACLDGGRAERMLVHCGRAGRPAEEIRRVVRNKGSA